jgi:hypothetical protein
MLQLKPRQAVEEAIENWDDDDLDIGGDDFAFPSRATSIATTGGLSHHRESISSRLSIRSDFDSNHGDEERHVQVPGHDERSRNDAIAAATRAGIPLPQNVPTSALMGGTIKRLGGRKVKRIIQQDDWDDELELPGPGQGGFQIKRHDPSEFPDTLRQVSGSENSPSPAKKADFSPEFHKFNEFDQYATIRPKAAASVHINLEMFRDNDDDDDFFGGRGGDTIKVAKKRLPRPVTVVVPPTPVKRPVKEEDDFESDFQLPTDGKPLRLSIGKDIPMTPVNTQDDFDEWAEGSLGTRFGGTRRSDGRSNRSSSASALSPSVSSSITIESEDEGLDGLVLPSGPLNFEDILKRRQQTQSPEHEAPPPAIRPETSRPGPSPLPLKDDLLSGLEIGDGDVFNSNGRTLNRNVKVKTTRQLSPQRPKIAVSLKFTDKPSPPVNSRLPRPLGHERHASNLDPVFESGGPLARAKRSQSRLGGHSAQSSVSSIPTPATPTSAHSLPPSTPRRRDLAQKPSLNALRNEPTTTNAQLLKLKRSMPIIRNTNSPAKPMMNRYERPSSRTDNNSRPNSMIRPKTPIERDRSGAESSMSRRNPVPFLPAGNSSSQSHHVTIKTSRHFRQNDSMSSNVSLDLRSASRAMSRATIRSPSPNRARLRGPEALAREAASKRQLTKPSKQRHFGDGRELDGFDDLPTSQTIEQKYIKQPIGRGPPKALLRNKVYQNNPSDRANSSTPLPGPYSPARYENRYENLPRFARDTNASRMAREQVLSQRQVSHGRPLSSLTNQWKAQVAAKTGLQPIHPPQSLRAKKSRSSVQQKPHLIKPLSDMSKSSKCRSCLAPL